jgi:hypothetical protein
MSEPKHRYPAISSEMIDMNKHDAVRKILEALRERVQIISRDRGRVEDSMVRVGDLIDLGLIKASDLTRLKK